MPSPRGELAAQLLDMLQAAMIREVVKPWGGEVIIDCGEFLLKLISVDEKHRTSLQHHEVKDEVQWVMFAEYGGGVEVKDRSGEEWTHYVQGDVIRVQPGTIHRTIGPCLLLEVTTPENDDVVRHEDDYDRAERKPYEKPTLTHVEDDGLTDNDLRGLMQ